MEQLPAQPGASQVISTPDEHLGHVVVVVVVVAVVDVVVLVEVVVLVVVVTVDKLDEGTVDEVRIVVATADKLVEVYMEEETLAILPEGFETGNNNKTRNMKTTINKTMLVPDSLPI